MEILTNIMKFLEILGISIWTGSIIFFSFGVAGTIFKNLSSKTEAGKLNGIILKKLNKVEHLAIKILLFCFIFFGFTSENHDKIFYLKAFVFLIMSFLTFFYSLKITTKTELLKEKIGNFDNPENTSPERQEFNRYHKMYVKMLSANLFLGLFMMFLISL